MTTYNSDDQNQNSTRFRAIGADRESQKVWRMEQVLKYASMGYNQTEISEVMNISQAHVSRTLSALKKAAQKDIKHHIEETLPLERRKALMLFESIKKQAIEIANASGVGNRDRVAALALAKDIIISRRPGELRGSPSLVGRGIANPMSERTRGFEILRKKERNSHSPRHFSL